MLKNYFEILGVDEKAGDLKLLFSYQKKLSAIDFPKNEKALAQYNNFNDINEAYIILSEEKEKFMNFLQKELQNQEFTQEELIQIKKWQEKGLNHSSLVAYRGKLQSKLEFYVSAFVISLREMIVFVFRFIWEFIKNFFIYLMN